LRRAGLGRNIAREAKAQAILAGSAAAGKWQGCALAQAGIENLFILATIEDLIFVTQSWPWR